MAFIGYGIDVSYEGTSIGYLKDVSGFGLTRSSHDSFSNSSTNGWREKIPGIKDAGELTFTIIFNSTTAPTIGQAVGTWVVTFPDGGVWTCEGFVTAISPSTPLEDVATADYTITLTGEPTFA